MTVHGRLTVNVDQVVDASDVLRIAVALQLFFDERAESGTWAVQAEYDAKGVAYAVFARGDTLYLQRKERRFRELNMNDIMRSIGLKTEPREEPD